MFNRKLLALILPIVATTVVVGSGFSSWYFEADSSKLDVNGTVSISNLIEGKMENADSSMTSFNVNLDQGGFKNIDVDKGISVYKSNKNDLQQIAAKYTLSAEELTGFQTEDAAYVELTCTMKFDKVLMDYIDVKTDSLFCDKVTTTPGSSTQNTSGVIMPSAINEISATGGSTKDYQFKIQLDKTITPTSGQDYSITFGVNVGEDTTAGQECSSKFLKYVASTGQTGTGTDPSIDYSGAKGKPTNKGCYKAMKDALNSVTSKTTQDAPIKFEFKVDLSTNPVSF